MPALNQRDYDLRAMHVSGTAGVRKPALNQRNLAGKAWLSDTSSSGQRTAHAPRNFQAVEHLGPQRAWITGGEPGYADFVVTPAGLSRSAPGPAPGRWNALHGKTEICPTPGENFRRGCKDGRASLCRGCDTFIRLVATAGSPELTWLPQACRSPRKSQTAA